MVRHAGAMVCWRSLSCNEAAQCVRRRDEQGRGKKKTRDCFAPRRADADAAPASVFPHTPRLRPVVWFHPHTHTRFPPIASQVLNELGQRIGDALARVAAADGSVDDAAVDACLKEVCTALLQVRGLGRVEETTCALLSPRDPPPPTTPHPPLPPFPRPTSTSSSSPSCAPTSSPPLPPPTGGPASTARASWRRRSLMN